MKPTVLILSAFIVLLTLPLATASAQPKIKALPGPTFDMGDVYQGIKAEKVIAITNAGTDTLRITEVKAQCGCTATRLGRAEIGPADSSQLSIMFDTHNQMGRVTKQVYISSNDSTTPKLTVQFTANVIQVLQYIPTYFSFDDTKLDSTYTKSITVLNPSRGTPVTVLSVETTFEDIKVDLKKKELKPGEQTQLEVVFHPTKPGAYQGVITLTTDNASQQKSEIKVNTWVNRK
jgi:hypothetical protein